MRISKDVQRKHSLRHNLYSFLSLVFHRERFVSPGVPVGQSLMRSSLSTVVVRNNKSRRHGNNTSAVSNVSTAEETARSREYLPMSFFEWRQTPTESAVATASLTAKTSQRLQQRHSKRIMVPFVAVVCECAEWVRLLFTVALPPLGPLRHPWTDREDPEDRLANRVDHKRSDVFTAVLHHDGIGFPDFQPSD